MASGAMTTFLQLVFTGVTSGAIYGLVATGYALGYSVSGVINFSHGQLLMVAAMVTSGLYASTLPGGLAAGLAASTAMGALVYLLAIRPVLKKTTGGGFAWLVSTLGVAIILEAVAALIYGTSTRSFPVLLQNSRVSVDGASITWQGIIGIGCVLAVGVGLEVFRRRSLFGKAAMAVAADPEQAAALGINVTRTHLVAFALAGLLAGGAGVLVAPGTFASPYMGEGFGVTGFVALLLGGISNPTAAIGGGFILGLLQATASVLIGPSAVDWFPLVVLVAVLLVAPYGVFGRRGLRVATS